MRQQVATALVFCGTLMALVPSISDYLHGYQVSQFLSERIVKQGVTRISQPIGQTYRASAWVLGGAMIGLGVLGGRRRPWEQSEQNPMFGRDILGEDESQFREPLYADLMTVREVRRA